VAERHHGREREMKNAMFKKGNTITRRRSESGKREKEKCDQLLTTGYDRKGGNDRNEKAHKEPKEVHLPRQEIHYHYHHECCGRRKTRKHENLLVRNQEQTTIALLLLFYVVMQNQSKLPKQSVFSAFNSDIDLPTRSPPAARERSAIELHQHSMKLETTINPSIESEVISTLSALTSENFLSEKIRPVIEIME
jgi:hypothetical protein